MAVKPLKIASAPTWTLSHHFDDMAYDCYSQQGFLNTSFTDQVSRAPTYIQLQDNTVNDKLNHSLLQSSVRNPGIQNGQAGQIEDNGSQTQDYTIDHIVKDNGYGRERKFVIRLSGCTARDN